MAAITLQDVVDEAPLELDAYSQTVEGERLITKAIADAEATVDSDTWGARYSLGLALYAAHLVLSRTPSLGGAAASGPVSKEELGDYSVSYASTAGGSTTPGRHSSTRPGALYDAQLAALSPGFLYF